MLSALTDQVFVQALTLPPHERLSLARELIISCGKEEPKLLNRKELEELLAARAKAIDEGEPTYDISETLARARAAIALIHAS